MTSRIIHSHWGQQTAFRIEVQTLAQAVFDELDPKLRPEVFLAGLVADHEDGVYPLFLDTPGEEEMPGLFQEASARAKEVRAELYEEARQEGKDPAKGDPRRRIVLEAWRQAVESVLAGRAKDEGMVSFCSVPRPVEEFLVCTVLRLKRDVYRSYYQLRKDAGDLKHRRPASLVDAAVEQFMRRCVVGMAERHSGMSASMLDSDPEEILRAGGRLLTDAPALAGQSDLRLAGLFHACNTISSLRHEGKSSRGELLISAPDHPGIVRRVTLRRPVRLPDHVAVRKMLETNRPGYSLLSDGATIYGLGATNLESSVPAQNLFSVRFVRHYTWELSYGTRSLMRVAYGHPRLPLSPLGEGDFDAVIQRTFPGVDDEGRRRLWAIAAAAIAQSHGTMVVFTEAAVSEAERLGQQAAPLEPMHPDRSAVLSLTNVDGALIADPAGVLHAFGVILDGKATTRGDPARGARFNSALRYTGSSKAPCVAVVVSEDGAVDLLTSADRAQR
jgi:hypothetical protein